MPNPRRKTRASKGLQTSEQATVPRQTNRRSSQRRLKLRRRNWPLRFFKQESPRHALQFNENAPYVVYESCNRRTTILQEKRKTNRKNEVGQPLRS